MLPRTRRVGGLVASLALLATLLVGIAPAQAVPGASQSVFINELHYDNTGGDVGEFVEVAGPAGTDLSGWTIELYNGSNSTSYNTIALSGTIDDEGSGFGAVHVDLPANGLQNGAPDGLALVDPSSTAVQFLSYEGTFTASGGPADGLTSTDIGVSETSGTAIGESLQLTGGPGAAAGDFSWTGPLPESPGSLNADQVFGAPPPPAAPAITEIHYDNTGGDVGEFVEVAGPAGTDLSGWTIELYNGSNSTSYNTIALSGTIDDEGAGEGAVSFSLPANGLQNGAPDGLALVDPSSTVIEFLSYEGTFTASGGPADGLTSTDIGVSESSGTAIGESLQLIDGIWTGPAAESPGVLNTPPAGPVPAVNVTEIHYDNFGTDTGEFVEVAGPAGTDLAGLSLVLYNGSNSQQYNTIALTGTIDDEGAGEGAVSFGLPVNGLQNGAPDGLALVFDDGSTETVIEFLSYEGTITASGGPADGLTSTDIGVSEPGEIGESLQLVNGTWIGPVPESPGVLNTAAATPGLPFPVVENFDTDCVANGWQIVSVDSDTAETWACSTSFSNVDVNAFGGSAPADDWFISPALNMEAQDGETLEFRNFTRFNDVNYPQLEVLWAADYNGVDPTLATWTALTGINFSPEASSQFVDSGVIDLSGISGDRVHVAFRYTSSGNGAGSSSNWRLDQIEFGPVGPVTGTPAKIHEVQGNGSTVAITGPVEVQAIVTSLFEDDDVLDGFFIQEEDADADADPATSEGIFVFCRGNCPTGLLVGDLVTVTGTPTEFQGMSQIDVTGGTVAVDGSGNALPAATPVSLPAADRTDAEATFEAIEGMVVSMSDELFVSEYFELARFGQLVLTQGGVPFQFTDNNAPDVAGYNAFLDELAAKRIILDDDNLDQNDAIFGPDADEAYPWPVPGLSTLNTVRGGDSITGLTGVMHWSRQGRSFSDPNIELAWRVRPIQSESVSYEFTANNQRPVSVPTVGGTLTVASFNVLNYFLTLDDGSSFCDFACRGADSAAELNRQRDKIVSALVEMNADVVGLIEIENDADVALADLVGALNAELGAGTYDYIATGVIGTDAIKVALIFKPTAVTPVGAHAILDSSVDPTFIDTKNRPVLIQTFDQNSNGERFTVAVNHLKSKGSPCDDVGDPGLGDGQANCAGTRTAAAIALSNYLATDPTGSGDPDFLITGDINAYAKEDPILVLEADGYTNLIDTFVGDDAYSFLFDGQRGYLDHALANPSLLPQVAGAVEWSINADEVPLLDYNDDIRDTPAEASFERESGATTLYDTTAFRSSDHDPVIVGLDLQPVYTCGSVTGTVASLEADGYNVILGDDRANNIVGTEGPDFIVGFRGNDKIRGKGGDDVICGDAGRDTLDGGSGEDFVSGGEGKDTIDGGSEDDTLLGGDDRDTIRGGQGDDTIDGGADPDRILAGPGNDVANGGADNDTINGNSGDDQLFGDDGDDDLKGNSGTDTCDGGPNTAKGDKASSCETVIDVP